jgi:hypothetical protein
VLRRYNLVVMLYEGLVLMDTVWRTARSSSVDLAGFPRLSWGGSWEVIFLNADGRITTVPLVRLDFSKSRAFRRAVGRCEGLSIACKTLLM